MPSSGQRRKGPGPLTGSVSSTEAAEQVQVICECRHTREVCGSRVWPGDPRAAAGVFCLAGAGQADGPCGVLPGGTSDIGGDDVGGVPVETAAGAVVSHGGPGISVGGGFLYVPQ
jgi:hypothetical protein